MIHNSSESNVWGEGRGLVGSAEEAKGEGDTIVRGEAA